ncbi:general secretion pathway protein K [Sinorhizobium terangae]|uniref:General secretion pathway protein GspK n=1 Tax=Sinorhizobium terangae TaxID=110322 RepID=A0A6N7LAL5_SINTE|nr:general secretion pathway protein GspK [Sinorhizobium terangae]MBB4187341.1 general secretion pathway protein K [Sinorhizobium terangae]MQX14646.1 general secretion pathway protein GspK [Sinorhizobium terangae]
MKSLLASLRDRDGGFGLISALLFMLLISAAITPLAIAGRVQVLSTAYTHERREFEILADGLTRTIYALNRHENAPLRWQRCETERYVFYVDIQDQSGLVDLNSASPQLLQFGFRALGLNETDALTAATLAERYRSPGGGDADDISGSPVDLKHAPFEDVTELADLIDAEKISMSQPQRIFTVFNKTDTVALRHVGGHLRRIIEEGRGLEFLADGAGHSSVSEVSIVRFRKGRPSGFLFQAMMERAAEEGERARMLRRTVSVMEEGDTAIPTETGPCRGVAELLTRSYDQ